MRQLVEPAASVCSSKCSAPAHPSPLLAVLARGNWTLIRTSQLRSLMVVSGAGGVIGETLSDDAKAKAVVDGAPKAVLEGANKETADKAKAALEEAGATVTLK